YAQFHEVIQGERRHIYEFLTSTDPLVLVVTWAAIITALVQLLFLFNFFWSMFKGERAGANPWEATTLEWDTPSPPPFDNFGGRVPTVYRGAYEFAVPGAPKDYVMQTEPDETAGGAVGSEQGVGRTGGNGHDGHGH
ncbi:MAG TPA: hypothetical protein VGV59_21020, partial [Pyrinomonadaceae bacterium]|nr:hypothetical protein [Pyrinomonadaceae bacterium]